MLRRIAGVATCCILIIACEVSAPERWVETVADVITVGGVPYATIHHDTSTDSPESVRLRVTAHRPFAEMEFLFGIALAISSCPFPLVQETLYRTGAMRAGETREVGRAALSYRGPSFGVPAVLRIDAGTPAVGHVLAGAYSGTWTSGTTVGTSQGFIDVNGNMRMRLNNMATFFMEGTVAPSGIVTGFMRSGCFSNRIDRVSTAPGGALARSGAEVRGTLVDSVFRISGGVTLDVVTPWEVRFSP